MLPRPPVNVLTSPIETSQPAALAPTMPQNLSDTIPEHLWPGMLLLLQAHDYAVDVNRDHWDFAVDLTELRRVGLSKADCRWLICKGWAELARELPPRAGARRFRRELGLTFSKRACLILSTEGVRVVREQWTRREAANRPEPDLRSSSAARITPCWDGDRHELRVGGRLVKQFKLPSPNQEMILAAFEEEGWPVRIDDPLPPSQTLDAKQRLHDTIKNLNRNQKYRGIRFMGDGSGQGILWELIVDTEEDRLPRRAK